MDKSWSIYDVKHGARGRTTTELPTTRNKKYNCSNSPLFPFIPLDHVIIDTLHLFLRITDLLINLLVQDLLRRDGINKTISKLDRSKQTNVAKYEQFLNEQCGISFKWYVSEDKKLKWRDLTGPEKQRLFNNINVSDLFPDLDKVDAIQAIWSGFTALIKEMNGDIVEPDSFKLRIKEWVRLFLTRYQAKNVTPYMHAFAMHIPEFIHMYGNLAPFSQQGLEKLNDITTIDYRRSTNHHQDALEQILRKRNRLEYITDLGIEPKKRKICCSRCKGSGHNVRSCKIPIS